MQIIQKCMLINWQANKPPGVASSAINIAEFSCHYALWRGLSHTGSIFITYYATCKITWETPGNKIGRSVSLSQACFLWLRTVFWSNLVLFGFGGCWVFGLGLVFFFFKFGGIPLERFTEPVPITSTLQARLNVFQIIGTE